MNFGFSVEIIRKLNEKSWRRTKRLFIRRLKEIAASGEKFATFDRTEYCEADRIIEWLTTLGFNIDQSNVLKIKITWEDRK